MAAIVVLTREGATAGVLVVFGAGIFFVTHCERNYKIDMYEK